MNPKPVHRLPAPLESAVQRIKLASRAAVDRTVESLGLAALASNNVFHRDALLGAQFELNRKSAIFALAFNEAFDLRVLREVGGKSSETAAPTSWDALSLVEDRALELEVLAERFAMELAHGCEWELRELSAYITPLLGQARGERERNPLRPEVVGHAVVQAIEATADRPEVHKVLTTELGRSLSALMRGTYAEIVADWRQMGIQPVGLSVRQQEGRSTGSSFDTSGRANLDSQHGVAHSVHGSPAAEPAHSGARGPQSANGGRGTPMGQVDPALMSVIRRLAFSNAGERDGTRVRGDGGHTLADEQALPNLIHAHREELRQASQGSLDHMVIDVIGSLFDQILSDPKVPPQVARQIARLQLPVLRAALGDNSFFSSRRHPVRRFINRIASLGAAFEDFDGDAAQGLLAKVRALVQDVVEGDFDQMEVYEQKLAALETFINEQGRSEANAQGGAAELLSAKEDDLRLRLLYAHQLDGDLKGLSAPDFVRDFISQVWSHVLLRAAEAEGQDSVVLKRLRHVGRELFMSVQAKTSPQQRKAFLADLPGLMKALGEGMALIGWPDAQRREFFGRLLPAHAESLKAQPLRPLDFNMLSKQVDGVLDKPLPSKADLRSSPSALPVVLQDEVVVPHFSVEEAQRIGLIDEAHFDWNGQVDIDLSAEPEVKTSDLQIAGLPTGVAPMEPPEAVQGVSLVDNVQIGFAYQMHLDGSWQKVRLVHVSPGRSFFVFNRGKRHKQTISLTQRMLMRLCETGRMRAFENAYLLERATARARRQLSTATPQPAANQRH